MANYCNAAGVSIRNNSFGLTEYDGRCSFFEGNTALPEGLGWFIVVGLGASFSIASYILFRISHKYSGEKVGDNSEFATAGRSVNTGLIACNIVDKWTWAATLLQSSNVAYKFGVSGPFWYASGATIQVLLFSILAVEIKRKAPHVVTVLEIVKTRWGKAAHLVFLFFCICTNIIVTSMLILGGAAVINALTGMDLYAAAFLIPIGVVIYTANGGLKATFIAAWAHVAIIYLALCIFTLTIYGSSKDLGSPSKVYANLRVVEQIVPVPDNMSGSYVTMYSKSGLIFGIINIIGNFGTVFVDQSYWQGAIAARPSATYRGYLLGGLCWFAIPFTLATSLGLGGRALDLPITLDESNAGLVPPAVATHLLGKGGAFLITLQLFMAVISTSAAEQMAVSSLITYDVYREYVNPKATPKQTLLCSRIMVFVWACISGVLAIILFKIGLNLGWVYLFMGIIIGSAVFPIACSILWNKVSAKAAILSAVITMPLGVMTWLVTAATLNDGVIDLNTTGQDYPMLAGNLVSLIFSAILCCIFTKIWPDNFNWDTLRAVNFDVDAVSNKEIAAHEAGEDSEEALTKVLSFTYKTGGTLSIVLIIVWPVLTLPAKVFNEGYFTFWVVLAIIWGLCATLACVLTPLWDARDVFGAMFRHIFLCQPPPTPESKTADPSVDVRVALDTGAAAKGADKA